MKTSRNTATALFVLVTCVLLAHSASGMQNSNRMLKPDFRRTEVESDWFVDSDPNLVAEGMEITLELMSDSELLTLLGSTPRLDSEPGFQSVPGYVEPQRNTIPLDAQPLLRVDSPVTTTDSGIVNATSLAPWDGGMTLAEDNGIYDPAVEMVSYQQPSVLAYARLGSFSFQENEVRKAGIESEDQQSNAQEPQFLVLGNGVMIPMDSLLHKMSTNVPEGPEYHPKDELTSGALTREIRKHGDIAKSDNQIGDAERTNRLEILSKATAELHKNETYVANIARYRTELENFPHELEQLTFELAASVVARPIAAGGDADSSGLQAKLEEHKQKLHDQRARLQSVQHEIDVQRERITTIPGLRSETRSSLLEVEQKLVRANHDDEASAVYEILLHSRQLADSNRLEMLDVEVKWQEFAGKVLPMRRDALRRRTKLTESEVADWQETIAGIKRQEISAQEKEASRQAIAAHPELKTVAQRNRELTRCRIKMVDLIRDAEQEKTRVSDEIVDVNNRYETMTGRIEATGGVTAASGALLVENRRVLLPPFESMVRVGEIEAELQQVNLEVLHLEEEREMVAVPSEFVNRLLEGATGSSLAIDGMRAMAIEIAIAKGKYLHELISDYDDYRVLLSDIETERKTLIERTNEAREFIDEHALWIRSSEPIGMSDIKPAAQGVASFFALNAWQGLGKELVDSLLTKPQRTALWVVSLLGLVLFTQRIKPRA